MLPLINKDYEGELQNIGDTVQVRTLGSITLGSYAKGGTISYEDLAPVKEAMTISDAEYFAFKVDDLEKAQNDINAMDAYTKRAAVGMKDTIERKLLSFYAQALVANQITDAGAAITLTAAAADATDVYTQLVKARGNLSKQNVPMDGRWVVVDPDTTGLLLNDTKRFIRATDLGDQVVQSGLPGMTASNAPGFVGRCAGFDIYESNAVPVAAGSKYIQYGTRMAISYAAQLTEMEAIRLQDTFATAIRGLLLHDGNVFAEASKAFGYIKAAA
jgi:hypothetical protein